LIEIEISFFLFWTWLVVQKNKKEQRNKSNELITAVVNLLILQVGLELSLKVYLNRGLYLFFK